MDKLDNDYKTAIEWSRILDRVQKTLKTCPYNSDLVKLFKNTSYMVNDLSRMEVQARQNGSDHKCIDQNEKIRQSIDYLEKLTLMLKLMS